MGREQLQGTPWHEEQMHRTCKDGSTNCLYNRNGKCAFVPCKFYNQSCKGKGDCGDFESKAGTPKVYSEKTIIIKQNPKNSREMGLDGESSLKTVKIKIRHENQEKELPDMSDTAKIDSNEESVRESKEEKFKRISKDRVNKILNAIETLENLSNRNQYTYSEEQVEKMFSAIESSLAKAKGSFLNKKSGQKFEW